MLNFKQFLSNATSFMNGSNETDPFGKMQLPAMTLDIPSVSTAKPVEVFKITKKGKVYEICAENNITWYCPADQYMHLLHKGKAPEQGDKVYLEFYKDGSVKSFQVTQKKESGLGDK